MLTNKILYIYEIRFQINYAINIIYKKYAQACVFYGIGKKLF